MDVQIYLGTFPRGWPQNILFRYEFILYMTYQSLDTLWFMCSWYFSFAPTSRSRLSGVLQASPCFCRQNHELPPTPFITCSITSRGNCALVTAFALSLHFHPLYIVTLFTSIQLVYTQLYFYNLTKQSLPFISKQRAICIYLARRAVLQNKTLLLQLAATTSRLLHSVRTMPPSKKQRNGRSSGDRSPFFAPTTPKIEAQTPGGTNVTVKKEVKEHKSTVFGASANLMNAIVGAGIVSIPYALKESGMVTGVLLVALCAFLTNKSLRLLVETAKHTNVPSYETLAEACFGSVGFLFVSINMFIMSYGAMISYLMITKDTLPVVMGVAPDDIPMKNALLFVISLTVMVPLSSQRDMADLAKTSRVSVTFDCIMVLIVAIIAPWQINIQEVGLWNILASSLFRPDTVFIGLGVLSFAFVCQVSNHYLGDETAAVAHHPILTASRTSTISVALGIHHCRFFGEPHQGSMGKVGTYCQRCVWIARNSLWYSRLSRVSR